MPFQGVPHIQRFVDYHDKGSAALVEELMSAEADGHEHRHHGADTVAVVAMAQAVLDMRARELSDEIAKARAQNGFGTSSNNDLVQSGSGVPSPLSASISTASEVPTASLRHASRPKDCRAWAPVTCHLSRLTNCT